MIYFNGLKLPIYIKGIYTIKVLPPATPDTPTPDTPTQETLTAPKIFLYGDDLFITTYDDRTEYFDILVDNVFRISEAVANTEFNLLAILNLSVGTYEITVKARARGYIDSPASNSVLYKVASIKPIEHTLYGTWVFNEALDTEGMPDAEAELIDGTSLSVDSTEGTIKYDGTIVYSPFEAEEGQIGWQDESYRTISFDFDNGQTVSQDFYDWFMANAVPLTITFTIDGTRYSADAGATWREWVTSGPGGNDYIIYTDPSSGIESVRPKRNTNLKVNCDVNDYIYNYEEYELYI